MLPVLSDLKYWYSPYQAKDMMVVMAAESEESTESTESTEQRTDLDSSDGTSSDDTGADDAGEEGQNTDENEQAGAVE